MLLSPVIYTDLDGTLLDHDTYSADEAKEVLSDLAGRKVPVIPATSKTFAEVAHFRDQMSMDHAFIVENGAAVYVPMDLNIRCPIGSKIFENYWVREFGVRRQALCDVIEALDMPSRHSFKSLNEMRPSEVAEITGLDIESAKRAQIRLYSETIDWRDSADSLEEFSRVLTDIGFAVSQGGRFVHLMGPNHKGIAALWFHNLLKRSGHPTLPLLPQAMRQTIERCLKTLTSRWLCATTEVHRSHSSARGPLTFHKVLVLVPGLQESRNF